MTVGDSSRVRGSIRRFPWVYGCVLALMLPGCGPSTADDTGEGAGADDVESSGSDATPATSSSSSGNAAESTDTGGSGSQTTGGNDAASGTTGGVTDESSGSSEGIQCPQNLELCGMDCVDILHDPRHCGACDQACDEGLACLAGTCALACGSSEAACEDRCVDLETDPQHCGACGQACPEASHCEAGQCALVCGEHEQVCDDRCVRLDNDEDACGACDQACPSGQPCIAGQCIATELHHVLITGQSLSVGYAAEVVSDSQPYDNLRFEVGVRARTHTPGGFVPLTETLEDVPDVETFEGETIASGLANAVSASAAERDLAQQMLVSCHGISAQPYVALMKGSMAYDWGMTQVQAAHELAEADGLAHSVRAVALVHGESDHLAHNLGYDEDLLDWQRDYEADIQAITGQQHAVPFFLCQPSSYTQYGQAQSKIPIRQLEAARRAPDRFYIVGPKYFLAYAPDGVHLTGESERLLGAYYAKVYTQVLIDGEAWHPVAPRLVGREGRDIFVDFHVPEPPLVFDTDTVVDPGHYGFEYFDSSPEPPTIESVELVADDRVRIRLSREPEAGNRRIRYAYTGVPHQPAGPETGARGNLRDSDPRESRHGLPLVNWAVHFDERVP